MRTSETVYTMPKLKAGEVFTLGSAATVTGVIDMTLPRECGDPQCSNPRCLEPHVVAEVVHHDQRLILSIDTSNNEYSSIKMPGAEL